MPHSLDQEGDDFTLVVDTPAGLRRYDVTRQARRRVNNAINEKLTLIEQESRKLNLPEIELAEFIAFVRGLREDPGL